MKNKREFKIDVPQNIIDDLRERINDTRLPEGYCNSGWDQGVDLRYLKALASYWVDSYDWRKSESELNSFNHFKADLNGTNIHFIYERGKGVNPQPIILSHGWPDSFCRYLKIIPMLTDPASYGGDPDDSFDVIIPSLPGFGFSDPKPLGEEKIADLWLDLMKGLGYEKFAAAGSNIGSLVTRNLAYKYPGSVTGIHLTDVDYPDFMNLPENLTPEENEYLKYVSDWWIKEGAFFMIQSTRPLTLSYGLNDSPIGWAAWTTLIIRGNVQPGNKLSMDEQLTNIMIYWITETINSSITSYLISSYNDPLIKPGQKIMTPTAVLHCTENGPLPVRWVKRGVNLKQFNRISAGQCVEWEYPEKYANDLRKFFRKLRSKKPKRTRSFNRISQSG